MSPAYVCWEAEHALAFGYLPCCHPYTTHLLMDNTKIRRHVSCTLLAKTWACHRAYKCPCGIHGSTIFFSLCDCRACAQLCALQPQPCFPLHWAPTSECCSTGHCDDFGREANRLQALSGNNLLKECKQANP